MSFLSLLTCSLLLAVAQPDSAVLAPTNLAGTRYTLRDEQPMPADARFYWDLEAVAFFKDNEFKGEMAPGYTFPGFSITPKAVWQPGAGIAFEAGMNLLYFWGSSSYPYGTYTPTAAQYSNKTTPLMLTPWLRLRWNFNPQLHLVLGSLYNNRNHDLPVPLYNDEWCYTARPESGLQLLFENRRFAADLWVNWQQYIFFNDPSQERILAGFSGRLYAVNNPQRWQISLPVHLTGKHYGGEFTDPDMRVQSLFNGAAGVSARRNTAGAVRYVAAECYLMGYRQTTDTLYPFTNGWGGYALAAVNYRGLLLSMAHWMSQDFVSVMGSPHYGNASTAYDSLIYYKHHLLVTTLSYGQCRWGCATLNLEGKWIHYLPWDGFRPGYGELWRGASDSFTIGLLARFHARKER